MLAFSKTKCSKTLAFPVMYYEVYRSAMQSVELFCAYLKTILYSYIRIYYFINFYCVRHHSLEYLYELDFSSALKTARKFFMRRDSGRHIDIIRLMMKYVHAVKDRFRQFQRPLRGISTIHFGYR